MSEEHSEIDRLRQESFDRLRATVIQWQQSGRIATPAGLKPHLQSQYDFDEHELGYVTFSDFVQAAAQTGRVDVHRQPNGHLLVTVPDHDTSQPSVPGQGGSPGAAAGVRLRADVWVGFVDWRGAHRRLWDHQEKRALMIPVDDDGTPAWESQPDRFTEIPAVSQAQQVEWMREFADAQHSPAREDLLAALDGDAAPGSFLRSLGNTGLHEAWRARLQQRVVEQAQRWASENGVSWATLQFRGAPARPAVPRTASEARSTDRASARPVEPVSSEAKLRSRLHAIIDRMTLEELAALPVRAEHLLSE